MLTADQLQQRRQGLGGSDASAVLGINPWKTPFQLWMEKTGQIDAPTLMDNEKVYWGTVLEDIVAREFASREGKRVQRVNRLLKHPEKPWLVANIDRRVVGERAGWEGKTTSAFALKSEEWGEAGTDQVPLFYLTQPMHYLAVTGWERWYLSVLIGGQEFRNYIIERDEDLITALVEKEAEFWRSIEEGRPPAPVTAEDVALLYARDSGASIAADPEIEQQALTLQAVKAQIAKLQATQAELEASIKAFMASAATLLGADGKPLATWKTQSRRVLDQKALKQAHPELVEQFLRFSETRVFRLH